MKSAAPLTSLLCAAGIASAQIPTTPLWWPDKQGPARNGMVPEADAVKLPLEWNEAAGKGVAWKTAIEDEGHSTPVIGGDMIWFTAATTDGRKQFLYGINRQDGKIVHHKLIFENPDPEPLGNPINNYAAPSCVLEADALYVHCGTYGTARVNPANGEVVWQRRDIKCRHFRGPGSSPLLFEDLIILTFDGIESDQFVVGLDKATGRDVWRTKRSTIDYGDLDNDGKPTRDGDMRKAFCTPNLITANGATQLISPAASAVFGLDPRTGREIWNIRTTGRNAAIRPISRNDTAYINTGNHLVALTIDSGAKGDVTDRELWVREKHNASWSSAVLIGGCIYQADSACVANCVDLTNGRDTWSERLFTQAGKMFASAIATRERIYFFSETGEATVIAANPEKFSVLARNQLASGMTASPAEADGALYLRTKTHLYKIVR